MKFSRSSTSKQRTRHDHNHGGAKTEQLAAYADRILVFNEGRIALEGEPRQVFARRRELEQIGVRIPQVARLAGLLGGYERCTLPLTVEEGHLYLESILRR